MAGAALGMSMLSSSAMEAGCEQGNLLSRWPVASTMTAFFCAMTLMTTLTCAPTVVPGDQSFLRRRSNPSSRTQNGLAYRRTRDLHAFRSRHTAGDARTRDSGSKGDRSFEICRVQRKDESGSSGGV